jgi:hypothetical protein
MLSITAGVLVFQLAAAQSSEATTTIRGSAALPGSVAAFSKGMGLEPADPSTLLLRTIRLLYGRSEPQARRLRSTLSALLRTAELGNDRVPLPLTPQLWNEMVPGVVMDHGALVSAILQNRTAALVYYGLSALDDDTLRWVATDRTTLLHFRKHPEIFAVFGRSIRVRDGRVIVPGGRDAEPLWRSLVGADPARPGEFIERVFSGDGRLAFLYDVIAHLDDAHRRFALGLHLSAGLREARLRSLLSAFTAAAPEWRVVDRPFGRPPLDGAILLSTVDVTTAGSAVPPLTRRLWDRVFRSDDLNDVRYEEISDGELRAVSGLLVVDAAWLADRILRLPYAIGRRRLETLLFGQRVFHAVADPESAHVATALRGYLSFPALMITLERVGVTEPQVYVRAAQRAARFNTIQPVAERRAAIAEFQSALELIVRMKRVHEITGDRATSLVTSLIDVEFSPRSSYGAAFVGWLREKLMVELPKRATLEESVIAGVAGLPSDPGQFPTVEWEGKRYVVNPASGEFARIRAIREAQHEPTLDGALSTNNTQALADALISIVYAIHLGDPEGAAVTSSNVALRHDFGLAVSPTGGPSEAWHVPLERFDGKDAWRVRGSLLGLEAALPRLVLRRIDRTAMPGEPTLGSQDRQTLMLTAALSNPFDLTDQSRDAIAAAIAQGRARVAALAADPLQLDAIAAEAGLSEWRTQALAWSLAERRDVLRAFSLVELFWLGASGGNIPVGADGWGAAALRLSGCLCLQLPGPSPWEDLAGYSTEVLATRGADVPLKIAETLAALKLPATLGPALAGFVTQDVIDHASLAYPDDWEAFSRAVLEIPLQRMSDYVAALTVSGPLIEIK